MKIGVLLPQSKMYPLLAKDFLDGLRFGLQQKNLDSSVEIIFYDTMDGSKLAHIQSGLQKLFLQDGVHLTIAFLGWDIVDQLKEVIGAYKKPCLVFNMGAKIASLSNELETANFFNRSSDLWKSLYKSGKWSAENLGKKLAVGAYFYEAGFDINNAFISGFEAAGGTVEVFHIAPSNPLPNDYEILMEKAKEVNAEVIFAAYSERDAVQFFNKYNALGSELPVMCVSTMLMESILDKLESRPDRIFSCGSWFESDPSEIGSKYENETGEKFTILNKMGCEAAEDLSWVLQNEELKIGNGPAISNHLTKRKRAVENDRIVCTRWSQEQGNWELILAENLDGSDAEELKDFSEKSALTGVSGWKQTYLVS